MKDFKNKNLTNIRAYKEDAKKINELSFELTGIQKARVKVPEVIRRINNSEEIKKLLKKDAYFKRVKGLGMNNKGNMDSMIKMGFVLGVIISIFFVVSLMLPITQTSFSGIASTFTSITPSLTNQNNNTGQLNVNDTSAINQPIETANSVIQASGWLPYTALVSMMILFIVLAVNVRSHPSTMIIWIGFVILLVALTMIFSNVYDQQVALNPSYYSNQDAFTQWLNSNLPIVIALFGFLGGVFMFIVIQREPEYEVAQQ